MNDLTGKMVEVGSGDIVYTGRLVEMGEDEIYLQSDTTGWIVIPTDSVVYIREIE